MKSWISSAFEAPSLKDTNHSKETKNFRFKAHKSDETFGLSKQKNLPLNTDSSKCDKIKDNYLLLSEKYEPQTRNELVVNKSKIDEISNFLDSKFTDRLSNILLLTGTTGCGKYSTLRVLCKEKDIDFIIWNINNLKIQSINKDNHNYTENLESQLLLFEQFLFKSSRYHSNQIFETNMNDKKRVLLVKEIPSAAFYNIIKFQNLLRKFTNFGHNCILVFSFNTNTCSGGKWDLNPLKIFNTELKVDLKISEITFNPLANSFLLKALHRIITLENYEVSKNKEIINEICLISNGDLRFAINSIEFYFKGRISDPKQNYMKEKIKPCLNKLYDTPEINNEKINSIKSNGKDLNLNLFKGIGRILHRKHYDSANSDDFNEQQLRILESIETKLPEHLSQKLRLPLNHSPEDVYDKLPLNTETMLMFINQNYLDIYNDRSVLHLDETFESLVDISEMFVNCDYLISHNSNSIDYSNRQTIQLKNELSSLICIRTILFNSYQKPEHIQLKSSCTNTSKGIWKPLYSPYYKKAIELINNHRCKAINLFLHDFELFRNYQKEEFFNTILPYFCILTARSQKIRQLLTEEQKSFLNSLQFHINKGSIKVNRSFMFNQNDYVVLNNDDYSDNSELDSQNQDYKLLFDIKYKTTSKHLYDYDANVNITEVKI